MQIVMCQGGVNLDGLIAEFRLTPKHVYRRLGGFAARIESGAVEQLKRDARVRSVEADGQVAACTHLTPGGVVRMGVDHFPVANITGVPKSLDVDVAVLDSGIGPHPDLNVYNWFSAYDDNGDDAQFHGTAVAGVIGAIDNGFGVVGVAPGVRLWSIKVLPESGPGSWTDFIAGCEFVLENADKISVANMSLTKASGLFAPYSGIRAAIQQLVSGGVVVVAGAGNDHLDIAGPDGVFSQGGFTDDFVPAALPQAMAVSAMDPTNDIIAGFSNFSEIPREENHVFSPGGAIDVAAPGVAIATTFTNGTYVYISGTSFATPHVSGLVALYIATHGRAYDEGGVYRIRQAIIDASLPQSQWHAANTLDPDSNHEPLAVASTNWLKPSITASPAPQHVPEGETVTFIAQTGGMWPLTHMWLHDGKAVTDGGRISGAGTNTLVISNAQPADAGAYQLILTNDYGAVTSAVAALTVGACPGIAAPSGLAAWWRLEGNTRDAVGTNDGLALRGQVYGPAVVGNGLMLDSRSGPVRVTSTPALNPTNELSVEVWYKAAEFTHQYGGAVLVRKRFTKNSALQEQYSLLVDGNSSAVATEPSYGFTFTVNRDGGAINQGAPEYGRVYTPTNVWVPGNWYHVVGTHDGTVMKIYVNGSLLGVSTNVTQMYDTGQFLWIGGEALWDGSGTSFYATNATSGVIDEVSLYSRALTGSEVAMLYAAGSNGKCLPTAAQANPVITSVSLTNGVLTLAWSTVPGARYVVQSSSAIVGDAWTNLSGTITAATVSLQFSDLTVSSPRKFYRVQLLPP